VSTLYGRAGGGGGHPPTRTQNNTHTPQHKQTKKQEGRGEKRGGGGERQEGAGGGGGGGGGGPLLGGGGGGGGSTYRKRKRVVGPAAPIERAGHDAYAAPRAGEPGPRLRIGGSQKSLYWRPKAHPCARGRKPTPRTPEPVYRHEVAFPG